MRWAEDRDVQTVRFVPPVIERRRGEHREGAPDTHPRAQRTAESPEANRGIALCARPAKGGLQYQPAGGPTCEDATQVDRHVCRCPERIPAHRAMPRNVPDESANDADGSCDD